MIFNNYHLIFLIDFTLFCTGQSTFQSFRLYIQVDFFCFKNFIRDSGIHHNEWHIDYELSEQKKVSSENVEI